MGLVEIVIGIVGVIGTGIAIYQTAVINEGKKRKSELQYILAGISNAALQKQQAWQNQIQLLPQPETPQDWEIIRTHIRAKDEFIELANLTVALEGTIDSDNSAISAMMDKSIEIVEKNNKLQAEGLKNPLMNKPEPNGK